MAAGPTTRDDLIRAGLELNDELHIDKLFAGVTTAAVAERAGVTTGSFFHHFRNATEYAATIVRSYDRERPLSTEVGRELSEAVANQQLSEALSTVLVGAWQMVSGDPALRAERRGQMHLFAHHLAELPPPTGDDGPVTDRSIDQHTVGDVLRDVYRAQVDVISETWRQLLDQSEMRLSDPFDPRRLAVAVHALILGLGIVHSLDPDAVDDHLFAEVTAALAGAVSRLDLRLPRVIAATELGQETDSSPQARSGARRRQESRRRIVAATSGMFGEGWDSVSASEVAEVAGVSTQTVLNLFGNVRRVCAATFVRHLPGIEAAIEAAGPDRPAESVRGALLMLARAAADDPHPARALLTERVGVRAERGFDLDDDDIRVLVPIGIRISAPVAAYAGVELTAPEIPDVSASVIDFVLGHAVPRPRRSQETVDLAMRLLPTPDAGGTPASDSGS